MELRPGITGLVGANGAGKTTLMRILVGAQRPTLGKVLVGGHDIYGSRAAAESVKHVSWMPQAATHPKALQTLEFVAYLTWLRGVTRQAATEQATEALKSVGLGSVLHRKLKTLSGGMLRRVWLAQALAPQTEVLVLDEPSTGLDPRQRAGMVELLKRLAGGTVLLSSHILEDVAELADRVIVLDEGRIVHDSPNTGSINADWFLGHTGGRES